MKLPSLSGDGFSDLSGPERMNVSQLGHPQLVQPAKMDEPIARLRKKIGQFIAYALVLSMLGLLGWGLIKARAGPIQNGIAPDFTLRGFDGRTATLSELRGYVVVINFWASWCPPCREEAAYLEQTWRNFKDRGVVFTLVRYTRLN